MQHFPWRVLMSYYFWIMLVHLVRNISDHKELKNKTQKRISTISFFGALVWAPNVYLPLEFIRTHTRERVSGIHSIKLKFQVHDPFLSLFFNEEINLNDKLWPTKSMLLDLIRLYSVYSPSRKNNKLTPPSVQDQRWTKRTPPDSKTWTIQNANLMAVFTRAFFWRSSLEGFYSF